MDAWKRFHALGRGSPRRKNKDKWNAEQLRCLRSALEASAPPFLEFHADGKVTFHLSDRIEWLPPPKTPLPFTGERLRISDQITRLSIAPAPASRSPAGLPPPERLVDGTESTPAPNPLPPPLCEEKVVALLDLGGVYYTWVITGKTVFPTVAGVSIPDWIAFLHMATYETPNASVGIVNGLGRLQHARGYTNLKYWSDIPDADWYGGPFIACPNTLYRIASLTKPITAFAVKRMLVDGVEDHAGDPMTLDTPFPDALPSHTERLTPDEVVVEFGYPFSSLSETRHLDNITIQHLMLHAAGWCEDDGYCLTPTWDIWHGGDPKIILDHARLVSSWNSVYLHQISIPVSRPMRVLYAFSQAGLAPENGPFKWSEPGTTLKYSNFGYMLLGRILERGTGASEWTGWYDAVKALILEPLGMHHTFAARPTAEEAYPGEAPYFVNDKTVRYPVSPSILSADDYNGGDGPRISVAYGGGRRIDHTDTAGGLVSTVSDYCKFMTDQRLFDLYTPSIDPTGRLLNILSRNDVLSMRKNVFSGRSLAWFIDESRLGHYAEVRDGKSGRWGIGASYHTGSWAGTSACAYLFPPDMDSAVENVGIVSMANGDIVPHDGTPRIADFLAGTLSVYFNGFEWPDNEDYFGSY
jgi:CubicO group peptidase (beta-lactamase class C family)